VGGVAREYSQLKSFGHTPRFLTATKILPYQMGFQKKLAPIIEFHSNIKELQYEQRENVSAMNMV